MPNREKFLDSGEGSGGGGKLKSCAEITKKRVYDGTRFFGGCVEFLIHNI